VEQTRNGTIKQALTAYLAYWDTVQQAAEPFWFQSDLTIAQIKCLILLEVHKETTVGGVAKALGIGRPGASILVEQLVHARLATRNEDPTDRRCAIVSLTQEGRGVASSLHVGKEQAMAPILAALDPSDLSALTVGLKALTAVMIQHKP
jgi:DNA-binding MarR family transcriptional regulator